MHKDTEVHCPVFKMQVKGNNVTYFEISLKRKDLCMGRTGNIRIRNVLIDFRFCLLNSAQRYIFLRISVYGLRI